MTAGGIGAIIGAAAQAIAGGISSYMSTEHQLDTYEDSLKALTADYELSLKDAETKYNQAKDEALKSAARSDAQSTFNEKNTAIDTNLSLNQLSLQQQAEALSWNQQMQSNDQSTGQALSSMAASGTRNSSLEDAVDMQAAQNSAQLEMSEKQQRNSDNMQLASILQNLNGNVFSIQSDRTAAQDLRNSYQDGGYNQQIYQNELDRLKLNYETQSNQINSEKDWMEDNEGWIVAAAALGGAVQGAQTGYKVGDLTSKLSSSDFGSSTLTNSTLSFSNLTTGNGSSAWDNIGFGNYYFGNISKNKWY